MLAHVAVRRSVIKTVLKGYFQMGNVKVKIIIAAFNRVIVHLGRARDSVVVHDVSHVGCSILVPVFLAVQIGIAFIPVQGAFAFSGDFPKADRGIEAVRGYDVGNPLKDKPVAGEECSPKGFSGGASLSHLGFVQVGAVSKINEFFKVGHFKSPCVIRLSQIDSAFGVKGGDIGIDTRKQFIVLGCLGREVTIKEIIEAVRIQSPILSRPILPAFVRVRTSVKQIQFSDGVDDSPVLAGNVPVLPTAKSHFATRSFNPCPDSGISAGRRRYPDIGSVAGKGGGFFNEGNQEANPIRNFVVVCRSTMVTEFNSAVAGNGVKVDFEIPAPGAGGETKHIPIMFQDICEAKAPTMSGVDGAATPAIGSSSPGARHEGVNFSFKLSVTTANGFNMVSGHSAPCQVNVKPTSGIDGNSGDGIKGGKHLFQLDEAIFATEDGRNQFTPTRATDGGIGDKLPIGAGYMVVIFPVAIHPAAVHHGFNGIKRCTDKFDFNSECKIIV